ncbi:MAG: hypothetical protein K6C32_04010 [Bacilli bacterium]|nr:hypothetical protein [Bacilli bacterium]
MDFVFDFIREKFKILALAVIGAYLVLSVFPFVGNIFNQPERMILPNILYLVFYIIVLGGALLAVIMDSEKGLLISCAIIVSYSLFTFASEYPTARSMGGFYPDKEFIYIMWWVFALVAMIATIAALAICLLGKIFDGLSGLDFLVGILVLVACGSFFVSKLFYFFVIIRFGNPEWYGYFDLLADMVFPFVVLVAYAKIEKKLA